MEIDIARLQAAYMYHASTYKAEKHNYDTVGNLLHDMWEPDDILVRAFLSEKCRWGVRAGVQCGKVQVLRRILSDAGAGVPDLEKISPDPDILKIGKKNIDYIFRHYEVSDGEAS